MSSDRPIKSVWFLFTTTWKTTNHLKSNKIKKTNLLKRNVKTLCFLNYEVSKNGN